MEQHVYYFRDILMGSDELGLLFWFVSNIYKLNIIKYKLLEKKKSKITSLRISLCHHCLG